MMNRRLSPWVEVFPATTLPGLDNVFMLYATKDPTATNLKQRCFCESFRIFSSLRENKIETEDTTIIHPR